MHIVISYHIWALEQEMGYVDILRALPTPQNILAVVLDKLSHLVAIANNGDYHFKFKSGVEMQKS